MLYYRVKPQFDNRRKPNDDIYIANELYTPGEVSRHKLNPAYLEPVDCKSVHWFFGARFAD